MESNHPEAAYECFSVCFLKLEKHTVESILCFKNKNTHSFLFLKNINLNVSQFLIIKCIAFSSFFRVIIHTVVYFVTTSNLILIVILILTYILSSQLCKH